MLEDLDSPQKINELITGLVEKEKELRVEQLLTRTMIDMLRQKAAGAAIDVDLDTVVDQLTAIRDE